MIRKFILLIAVAVTMSSAAQVHVCGTDEHYAARKMADLNLAILEKIAVENAQKNSQVQHKNGNVYKIPVVFHVIHEYGDENISKEQILDQMRVLNEDFRRLNADRTNLRGIFSAVAADAEIEFVLANKDPNGKCTEGIVRVVSPLTNNARDAVKAVSYWPNNRYLNIWVVKSIENFSLEPETITLGYAQFPWEATSRASTDGVVIRSDYTGTIGTAVTSGKGRTLTHEVGHWLGLFHTFQGGCSGGGDGIGDTPKAASPNYGCNSSINSCSNETPNFPDMIENYMDYSNGSCMNTFTNGQSNYMRSMITSYRSLLVSIANQTFTGIATTPSSCAPIADMTNVRERLCAGSQLQFQDISYNGSVTNRTWTFEGGTPQTSSSPNPTVTYSNAGVYKVTLSVGNASGTSQIERTQHVRIDPKIGDAKIPFVQGFESSSFPPTGWASETQTSIAWTRTTSAFSAGIGSAFVPINASTPDKVLFALSTPSMDFSGIKDPVLRYKTAYAQNLSSSSERFRVYASEDCGRSYILIFQRGGAQMASAPNQNPPFIPKADQWKDYQVLMNTFKDKTNVIIKFEVESNSGNAVYIDDINITSLSSVNYKKGSFQGVEVYPNPFSDDLNIQILSEDNEKMFYQITDLAGRLLLKSSEIELKEGQNTINIDANKLNAGVFFVTLETESKRFSSKIVRLP